MHIHVRDCQESEGVELQESYRYHRRSAIEADAKNKCPLCVILSHKWPSKLPFGELVIYTEDDEDCIPRAVCAQGFNSPRAINSQVSGYPLSILPMGFVFGTVGTSEKFLTLYQILGDPASKYLTQSQTLSGGMSRERFGEQSVQETRRRLQTCYKTHESCPVYKEHELPTAVLDLDPPEPKLHFTAPGERGMYVALSYCWGGPQVKTTKATLQANMAGIALHTLSQTVQDSIEITRKLGIRYLWVDALSIVQDDEASQIKEIDRMSKIYSNATIAISAACAARATDGFLRPPPDLNAGCVLPFFLPDGKFGNVLAVPSQEIKESVLQKLERIRKYPMEYRDWREQEELSNTRVYSRQNEVEAPLPSINPWPLGERAWALQEHMLSTRLLVFGPDDVRWRCQETKLEPLFPNPNRYSGAANRVPLLRSPSLGHGPGYWTSVRGIQGVWGTTTRQLQLCQTIITDFSSRSISFEQDRLPALAGIASQLEELWGGQYVAGYWRSCLPELLAWVRKEATLEKPYPEDELKKLEEYLAPSWSWIAARRPVLLQPITDLTAEVISVTAEPLFPEARFGRLKSASLVLNAPVLPNDESSKPIWDHRMDHGGRMQDGMLLLKLGKSMLPKAKNNMVGLILQPADEQRYRRVGTFLTISVDIWRRAPKKTVTII